MPLVLKVSVAGVLIFFGAAAEESWEMFGLESWKWELNCPTTPEERLSSHCGSNWELKSSMTTNKLARDKFFHFCDSLKDIYTECPKQSDIRDRWRYQNGWFFWETSKGEGHFEKNCNMIFRKWSVGGGSKVVLVASPVPNKKISWWGSWSALLQLGIPCYWPTCNRALQLPHHEKILLVTFLGNPVSVLTVPPIFHLAQLG